MLFMYSQHENEYLSDELMTVRILFPSLHIYHILDYDMV